MGSAQSSAEKPPSTRDFRYTIVNSGNVCQALARKLLVCVGRLNRFAVTSCRQGVAWIIEFAPPSFMLRAQS